MRIQELLVTEAARAEGAGRRRFGPSRAPAVTRAFAATVALAAGVGLSGRSVAAPAPGATLPDVKLVDAWDRTRGLTDFAGGTIVVFYEDKDTAAQSQQVKDALRTAKTGDGRALPITVIPIADVKGYDYWPARGFVKDAVKKETKKVGQIIYLDWDGKAAQALSAQHGEASVIVYGKNGKVLASHGGAFTEGDARDFVAAVKSDL